MRSVVYSLSISLDGYIKDGDGRFDWSVPSDETFLLATDEVRGVDVHLLGRNLYESMLYWETAEQEVDLSPDELEFTRIWTIASGSRPSTSARSRAPSTVPSTGTMNSSSPSNS